MKMAKTSYIIISNIHNMHGQNKQYNTANQALIEPLIIFLRPCFQHNVYECALHKIQTHQGSLRYEWYISHRIYAFVNMNGITSHLCVFIVTHFMC